MAWPPRIRSSQMSQASTTVWCFPEGRSLEQDVARVVAPDGRLAMYVRTDQPSLQLYTGNFLAGTPARGGGEYGAYAGFALETQGLVDATKHAHFPSISLRPGEVYEQRTAYRFEALDES